MEERCGTGLSRHQIVAVLLVAGVLAILAPGVVFSVENRQPIPALTRYPWLEDYFAYGFWFADAPHARDLAATLGEAWEVRQEKTFHDLSRHNVNAVIPGNQAPLPPYLDRAHKYGLRCATMPLFLYRHMDNPKEETMERVKSVWSHHANQIRTHPGLLAYHVFDEPHPTISPKIQDVTDTLARVDPAHPAIYTHQHLPLNRDNEEWGEVEWALLDSLDVHLSDLYSIEPHFGRDPWLYGDVGMANYRKVDPDAIHWPTIQAFTFHATPTVPELRVMVFHTIACGAKGVTFFTTGQSYCGWIVHFYPSVGNAWFAEEPADPMYADISRMGRHLTSAGPLLMPRRLDPNYPVRVECPTFRATVRSGGLREDGNLTRPAIHVGAFAGKDFDVLVVHNDDPWTEHSGRVTISGRGRGVYDLEALEPVPARVRGRLVQFTVKFAPGNGRLYLVGDEADFEVAKSTVQRHWYERDRLLAGIEADIAGRCGVGVEPVREQIRQAADSAGDSEYARALELMKAARAGLAEAEAAHPEYSRTVTALDRMRQDLHRIDEWYDIHPYVVSDLADDGLKGLIERGTEYARQFVSIENALRAGKLRAEEAVKLQAEITAVADSIVTYRPEVLQKRRIALLELGEHTGDAFFLYDWLAMVYQHVDVLKIGRKSGFVNAEGRSVRPGSYDLLWIHLGDPGGPVEAIYCVKARVVRGALSRGAVTAIRKYVKSGGGLILSGLGAALVDDLGYDSREPNEKYWGPLNVPGGDKIKWKSPGESGKILGLKPKMPNHPIFQGLEADGFAIWKWGLSELVGKAVWRKPCWPRKGKVLAGYYSDGIDIPDEFAVVVEFTRFTPGAGKVIAVGDCLDPTRTWANYEGSRWGSNQDRFIRNLVSYCSRPTSGD